MKRSLNNIWIRFNDIDGLDICSCCGCRIFLMTDCQQPQLSTNHAVNMSRILNFANAAFKHEKLVATSLV